MKAPGTAVVSRGPCAGGRYARGISGTWRWLLGGAGLLAALGGLAAGLGRGSRPTWVRTIVLTAAATAFLWGPASACALEFPSLLPTNPAQPPSRLSWLRIEAARYAAILPLGLIFAIPAAATLADLWSSRRRRAWTEWAGIAAAVLLAGYGAAGLYAFRAEWPPDGLNAERIVAPLWVAACGWLGRPIVRRLGPAWGRRLGPGTPSEDFA